MSHASTKTSQPEGVDISTDSVKSRANAPSKPSNFTDSRSCSTSPNKFTFRVVCKTCWSGTGGRISLFSNNEAQCNRKHDWESNKIVLEVKSDPNGQKVVIRPLLKLHFSQFRMCTHATSKKGCYIHDCWFAHHIVERDVWQWQVDSSPKSERFTAYL